MNYKNPNIAAEICCNHQGDMEIAKQMIKVAADEMQLLQNFRKEIIKSFLLRSNLMLLTQIKCIHLESLMVYIENS